jgi:hypothetical protein
VSAAGTAAEQLTTAAAAPIAAAELRRVPYPYQAMLAICSDLDETPDRDVYHATLTYLNTTDDTAMGRGVGLEVGNTIYFDMPPDQFAYWNTDDAGRQMIRDLIKSGHVDCLHSFGDLATTRAHAGRALDELASHGCSPVVWVDHAIAPTNFGADIMRGEGDVPGAAAYHADLTFAAGVRYVWRGRVTSVIGQGVPRSLTRSCRVDHPVGSLTTLTKEAAKGALGRFGNRKYRMHAANEVLQPVTLRDGRPALEFLRANPHWGGVNVGETAGGLSEVLTGGFLDRLCDSRGFCVLYTHLGKVKDPARPIPEAGRGALQSLARARDEGRILVTTTRRLLDYCEMSRTVSVSRRPAGDFECIDVATGAAGAAASVDGLTVYGTAGRRVRLFVNGVERPDITHNAADATGRASVTIPWTRLAFPRA